MEPELIADFECVVGEGPLWHPDEQHLYWTDIGTGRMFRYDPATGKSEQVYQGEPVGGFTIQADGALLLFGARGEIKTWRDGTTMVIREDIPDERQTRFNDVFADPVGRVYCGTMPTKDRLGRLYRLDPDGTLTLLLEDVGTSNGMGLTPDRRQMYYTDTTKHVIYLFDYDQPTGALTNQRVFVRTPDAPSEGHPDGMTVDADGYVWSARWDGGCLVRYAPDGREVQRIRFPALKVSCPTFGGADYADLYVTCAGGDKKVIDGPGAGALFRMRIPGVRGVPEFRSRVGL
jgi:D-xylonolactonase